MDTENIAALRRLIRSAADPREKIGLLQQLSREIVASDPERAIKAANDALRLARRLDAPDLIIESLFRLEQGESMKGNYPAMHEALNEIGDLLRTLPGERVLRVRLCHRLGSLYLTQGDFPKGIAVLNSALDDLDHVDLNLAILILGTMADTYMQLGHFSRAFELLARVEAMAEEGGFRNYTAHCLECTGRALIMLGEEDAALEKFRAACELWRALGLRNGLAATLGNIAMILAERDDTEGALAALTEAIELERQFGLRQNEAYCILTMAAIVSRTAASDALAHAWKAFEIFEEIGDRQGCCKALTRIGLIEAEGGGAEDLRRAREHYLRALGLAEEIRYRPGSREIHEALAAICETLGDTATSLEHYKLCMTLERELQGQETRNALASAQARVAIERAEQEKQHALMTNARLEIEMEHRSKELVAMAIRLVEQNELMSHLRSEIAASLKGGGDARTLARAMQKQIDERAAGTHAWEIFEEQFHLVNQGFLRELHGRYPALRPAELKICALLRINLSSKEIAALLNISFRTVELHRTNIRKKLALPNAENLSLFLASL